MITWKTEPKFLLNDISCKCKVNLLEENVAQVKSRRSINVNVSVKYIIYVKKIFGMLLHIVMKIENI